VKSSLAGRSGRCPVCKATVKVPNPPAEKLSEDAILNILSSPDPRQEAEAAKESKPIAAPVRREAVVQKKSCHRCNREIPVQTHICPHCKTYIAGLSDFDTGT
jgi:RNA polymerase subunit RPABC4/transcription elongation factor Spt4